MWNQIYRKLSGYKTVVIAVLPLAAYSKMEREPLYKLHTSHFFESTLAGEFIPWWVIYPPVVVHGIYLSIKHRSLTLPTIANPGIYTGGAFGESKFELSRELYEQSPEFAPRTGLIEDVAIEARLHSLQRCLLHLRIEFPVVLKPDIGQGGFAVQIIRNDYEARDYLSRYKGKTLVQEYVGWPLETGIYYCRFPDQERGSILDITDKSFPAVTGDGYRTVKELILIDPRAQKFASKYFDQLGKQIDKIPARGEAYRICSRGNWAQGCIFIEGRRLWSFELECQIDDISRKMKGFYIGRYDIRYESEESLRAGRGFKILELDGITSMPISLKDPQISVWRAWGLLCHIVGCLYEVGARNRARGHRPMGLSELSRAFTEFRHVMKSATQS